MDHSGVIKQFGAVKSTSVVDSMTQPGKGRSTEPWRHSNTRFNVDLCLQQKVAV